MTTRRACTATLALWAAALIGCGEARPLLRTRPDDHPGPVDPEVARLPNVRGHFIPDEVFGGTMYALTAGPSRPSPTAPPLFLVHGLGDKGVRDFYPLLPTLAAQRTVVLFDLPGFGRSTRANAEYTPDRYAAVLARLIDRYAGGRVDVLGHSMGGAIALLHASMYPQQVRRLVVIDAAGILNHEALLSHQVHRATDLTARFFPKLAEWALDKAAAVMDEGRKLDAATELIMQFGPLRQQVLRGDPGAIAALGLVLQNFGPVLEKIQAPTALIWGAEDNVAPLRTGQLLVDRLPRARLTVLDGVGHVPMEEAPARLLALIEGHLMAPDNPLLAAPPPAALAARGDVTCHGQADVFFGPGLYGTIVLEDCARVTLEDVRADKLVLRRSSARAVHAVVSGGVVAQASELMMTGGQVRGAVALELDDSQLDLAGVAVTATEQPYRLGPGSRLLFSVCPLQTPAGLTYLQGFYGGPPAPPAPAHP
ncbi:MAG TPA: alpha/beta hydrolase [Polyangia bacterium]|nr:alpha/beta hydrolase [Polyangia bacterium]